ncbi:MAG: hypothetical protein CVU77_07520 [Elusimicrobia bacterium HGW-Elusimicrobia-1]|nr:MAG: hypothetical protein CVU77_07520 [Elusimicrobia bacterium HGW-Elusimicrobia-1]
MIFGKNPHYLFTTAALFIFFSAVSAQALETSVVEQSSQSGQLADDGGAPFRYNQRLWNEMRRRVEYGDRYSDMGVSTRAPSAVVEAAQPPGLAVDLPYESAIAISGRKLIALDLKVTQYLNPAEAEAKNIRASRTDLTMTQELQVRIKGRVGRKINVNIDFDDTTAEKRDISVVYKGDPDEVVQEAAFGDITVSLPQTEFVGYSRQLFGAKVDAKYRNMRFIGFGSKTKGQSEIKRFIGNAALERKEINDTAYIRYRYYRMAFGADRIKRGSEKIYLDDKIPANNNINTSSITVEIPRTLAPGATTFGNFDLLVPGQDYSVDYDRGVVYFRKTILTNYVIAVDYEAETGGYLRDTGFYTGIPKVIKDEANADTTERKNYYSIGRNRIVRDDGRGNFVLKIQDLNRADAQTVGGGPAPKYPEDIEVDFEQGFIYFKNSATPFLPEAYRASPTSSYRIFVEYRYRFKTFQLRTGIVPQSERVVLDGKTLSRDGDYFIDYDSGFITFHNEDKITGDSVIEISYDYAPFGITTGSTIMGLRGEIALTPNIFVGSSYLYEFSASAQALPDVKNPPSSLDVLEVDSRITDIKIPYLGWTLGLGGEIAQSRRNPNTIGKAIVESMEGIKQEDNVTMFRDPWRRGYTPFGYFADDIKWSNEEMYLRDINPAVDESVIEKRQVLVVNYDNVRSSEVAIHQSLSRAGLDFSRKLYMETWVYGDGSGAKMQISLGTLNEDIDGDGALDTEDRNGDGILNQGEDTGITFVNPDGAATVIGAGNGLLDTEDLDGNGYLNTLDNPVWQSPDNGELTLDWTGWRFKRIPLNIQEVDRARWETVKHARVSVRGNKKGSVKIAQISFVGQRWESAYVAAGSTLTIAAVNNEEDPTYKPLTRNPIYEELYDLADTVRRYKKEQALSLKYDIQDGSVAARLAWVTPYDLSQYRRLRFFVYASSEPAAISRGNFFLQAGNEANYFEFSIPVEWTGWKVLTIEQADKNRDGKPDVWESLEPGSAVRVVGSPALNNISQLKTGLRSAGVAAGEIWINEIYVEDTYKKGGIAYRYNADLGIPGWANLGGRQKWVDRNFETFTGGLANQDRLEESAYFNMPQFWLFKPRHLNWINMPLNTSFAKTVTVTPSVIDTKEGLVSVLEEGRVTGLSGSADTSISIRRFPTVAGKYTRAITDTHQIERIEDKETIATNASYTPPKLFILPTSVSGGYSVGYSYFRPWQRVIKYEEYLEIKDYLSLEESRSWNASAPYQFGGFLSVNPSFSQGDVSEEKKGYFLRDGVSQRYLKSQAQTGSLGATMRLANFFQPSFSYSLSVNENYNLIYSTVPPVSYPAETKAVTRSGAAEAAWNLNVRDLTGFAHTRSLALNSSYRIADGDSYDNVASTYSVRDRFWIRDALKSIADKRRSLTQSDTLRVSGRWNPLEQIYFSGRLAPWKTLNSNFTYSRSDEYSDTTGTERRSYTLNWPDLLFTLSDVEKMIFLERYASDTTISYKTALRYSETLGQTSAESSNYGIEGRTTALKRYSVSANYNNSLAQEMDLRSQNRTKLSIADSYGVQVGFNLGKWRLTARYDESQQNTRDGFDKLTADSITRTPALTAYWDYVSASGIKLPLIGRTLPLTNRFTFNTNLNLAQSRSTVNYEKGNTDVYNLNFTGDYEATSNFRVAVGGGFTLNKNLTQSYEDYYAININSRLTIQF